MANFGQQKALGLAAPISALTGGKGPQTGPLDFKIS